MRSLFADDTEDVSWSMSFFDVRGKTFYHQEFRTPNFGFVVAGASDAPLPLHCQCHESVVLRLRILSMVVNFNIDVVEQNWQGKVFWGRFFSLLSSF
jgi:hypothetical protein